jgi:MerR family copper efflux transcriptional regulator
MNRPPEPTPVRAAASPSGPVRMKIGELARKTGKTPRALHLYEEMGLLRPPQRTEGGFRLYGPDELARVYWIAKLQDMGFSLPQIQGLLATVHASETAPEAMTSVRELFRAKLDETRAQVMRLLQLERDLSESLAYLEGCRVCREPAAPEVCTTCTSERRDVPPSLVVGIHRSSHARKPEGATP